MKQQARNGLFSLALVLVGSSLAGCVVEPGVEEELSGTGELQRSTRELNSAEQAEVDGGITEEDGGFSSGGAIGLAELQEAIAAHPCPHTQAVLWKMLDELGAEAILACPHLRARVGLDPSPDGSCPHPGTGARGLPG